MRRIAALVDDGRVILEEIHWDDSADRLAEIPADRLDVEALVLKHVPGKIVYREVLSSNGTGIYGVEDDPTALAEADWQEPSQPKPEPLTREDVARAFLDAYHEEPIFDSLKDWGPESMPRTRALWGAEAVLKLTTTDPKPWRVEPREGQTIKGPTRFANYADTYPSAQETGRVCWDPRPEEER